MKMEGEIISRDFIKPSSPTPDSLKILKLSLLDQIVPPIYVPLVLYYPNSGNNNGRISSDFISHTTDNLKQSLSSTLSDFYPLAGRIRDTFSIDCNDEGVLFIVSRFNYSLTGFLENPDPLACRGHIPSELSWTEPGPGDRVAMIQVNFFSCGGLVIGSLFLHKVADGVTIGTFMKAWAARARNSPESAPSYKAQSFFPQNEQMQRESHLFSAMRRYFKFGKTEMRRYVFDASGIAKLRAQMPGAAAGLKKRPTRVELVSALIWRCFMAAVDKSRPAGDANPVSLMTHGVNMRRKADPAFPDDSFGNFVWLVAATSVNDGPGREFSYLFDKVRGAIDRVDSNFVKSMQGEDGFPGYCERLGEAWDSFPESAEYLAMSSWCNFGLYEIDFGQGRPAWISKCDGGSAVEWPFINVLWLMDSRRGDGVEAWVTLDEKCFKEFDRIQELRDVACVDPSPLCPEKN